MKEKIKPIAKALGLLLGLFILWIIFGMITGKSNPTPPLRQMEDLSFTPPTLNKGLTSSFAMPEIDMMEAEEGRMALGENFTGGGIELPEKRVIKNGDLDLKVDKTEEAADEISLIVKNQGGEVFSTNFYERIKGQKSGSMTVKVPVEKFETTIEEIKKISTQVISESTTGQDVSEQYADLQAQLKNKKAEEESFVKILDQASKIDDVLAITKQISRVRGEIERLEGRIKYMNSQTDLSTIYVDLSEDVEITPTKNNWRPWQVMKKSFSDLLNNMQDFVDGTIRFVIVGIPSMIPFLLFVWVVYLIGKKIWIKLKK